MRLRDPRFIATAALLGVLFALLALYDFVPTATYEHQVLFTVPWGTGADALGMASGADGSLYGPRSFAIQGSRVYVADTFNARVQVFDPDGSRAASIPLRVVPTTAAPSHPLAVFAATAAADDSYSLGPGDPWINDLVVDERGEMYLADSAGPKIMHFDADGVLVQAIDVTGAGPPAAAGPDADTAPSDPAKDEPLWLLERLDLDQRGLVYLAHTYLSDQVLARSLVRFDPAEARFVHLSTAAMRAGGRLTMAAGSLLPVPANSFTLAADGTLYVESAGADPFSRHVRRYGGDNKLRSDWVVRHDRAITGAALIGADRYNQAYLLVNGVGRGDGDGSGGAAVVRLVRGGGKVAQVVPDLTWDDTVLANVYARADKAGSIYLALPTAAGWRLETWRAKWRWTLQPAARRSEGGP